MKLYRLKHKPTGLYWRQAKGPSWNRRDQLHEKGKIFTTPIDLQWFFHTADFTIIWHNKQAFRVNKEDMEIEEIDQKESTS